MAMNRLQIPFPDFVNNTVISEEEFDLNNSFLQEKVNELVEFANRITGDDPDTGVGTSLVPIDFEISGFSAKKLNEFLLELIGKLQSTSSTSGADFIGATPVTGVSGTNVKAQIASLKSLHDALQLYVDTKYYKKTEVYTRGETDAQIIARAGGHEYIDGGSFLDSQSDSLSNLDGGEW